MQHGRCVKSTVLLVIFVSFSNPNPWNAEGQVCALKADRHSLATHVLASGLMTKVMNKLKTLRCMNVEHTLHCVEMALH
jgi:hypothetical protein